MRPLRRWNKYEAECRGPRCTKRAKVRGLCRGHYQQEKSDKPLRPLRPWRRARRCCVGDCKRRASGKGMCKLHLKRHKRLLEVLSGVEVRRKHAVTQPKGQALPPLKPRGVRGWGMLLRSLRTDTPCVTCGRPLTEVELDLGHHLDCDDPILDRGYRVETEDNCDAY